MNGKTVLITGSTDGVGRYVAAQLATAGAKVLIHGRDRDPIPALLMKTSSRWWSAITASASCRAPDSDDRSAW